MANSTEDKILSYCRSYSGKMVIGMREIVIANKVKVAIMRLDGWLSTWIDEEGNESFPWREDAKLNPNKVLRVADTWEQMAKDLNLIHEVPPCSECGEPSTYVLGFDENGHSYHLCQGCSDTD